MPKPSTISSLRTRRYVSTPYIHHAIPRLDFQPVDGGGRSIFEQPIVSGQPAHVVHFNSAFCSWRTRPTPTGRGWSTTW